MRDAVCSNPVTMETIRPQNYFHEHQVSMYNLPLYFSVPMFQARSAEMEVTLVTFSTRTDTSLLRIFSSYEHALFCEV